jgi:NADH-quinone oxidoreductase subunit G
VRFGQEIAGIMELGMAGHGEHSEILPFVGRTVDSELSGNMIDVCPVGALTSKPFRYRARTWELGRRKSIAAHDSLGSNIVLQVKRDEVVRVVPLENEAVNECWLSDRDRFSYEGLQSAERLARPLVRRDGRLQETTWPEALDFAAQLLRRVRAEHGGAAVGALASGSATAEELFLLGKLVRGLGSESIDFRARHSDFSADATRAGAPWLGMRVAEINGLDRLLLVGSFLRQDHPLLAARVRKAASAGCRVSVLHAVDDSLLMPLRCRAIAAPSAWPALLAQIALAVARQKSLSAPAGAEAAGEPGAVVAQIAADLCSGQRVALLAGNAALQHPQAARIQAWMQWIARAVGGRSGVIGEAANSVGGYLAGAVPGAGGRNARAMLEQPLPAYLLWGLEPELDCADPALARAALSQAQAVVAFSTVRSPWLESAHAVLPIAAFAETAGTFVNCEGRAQSFQGAVPPPGQARPGWKVLRVLGNQLELAGFEYESPEQVRAEALPEGPRMPLSNETGVEPAAPAAPAGGCERIADVPLYAVDPIVRRAASLQATAAARAPTLRASAATLARFGVAAGDAVRVRQGGREAVLPCELDAAVADGTVRLAAAHERTAPLGAMFGRLDLERA